MQFPERERLACVRYRRLVRIIVPEIGERAALLSVVIHQIACVAAVFWSIRANRD